MSIRLIFREVRREFLQENEKKAVNRHRSIIILLFIEVFNEILNISYKAKDFFLCGLLKDGIEFPGIILQSLFIGKIRRTSAHLVFQEAVITE